MNLNKCVFCGKVSGSPVAIPGENRVDFKFIVNERRDDGSGKWVEVPMKLPIFAYDKKGDVIKNYVVDGQELILETSYISWDNEDGSLGFGFKLINVELGFKPRPQGDGGGDANKNRNSGGPPQ